MKRNSALLLAAALTLLATAAQADHKSRFGDITGRTVGGAHDDRYENNTQSGANAGVMDEAMLAVESQGEEAYYMQAGYPATVVPGLEY